MKRVPWVVALVRYKSPGPGAAGNHQRQPDILIFPDLGAAKLWYDAELVRPGSYVRRIEIFEGDPRPYGDGSERLDWEFAPSGVFTATEG